MGGLNGTVSVEHEWTTFLDDVRATHGEESARKHTRSGSHCAQDLGLRTDRSIGMSEEQDIRLKGCC